MGKITSYRTLIKQTKQAHPDMTSRMTISEE